MQESSEQPDRILESTQNRKPRYPAQTIISAARIKARLVKPIWTPPTDQNHQLEHSKKLAPRSQSSTSYGGQKQTQSAGKTSATPSPPSQWGSSSATSRPSALLASAERPLPVEPQLNLEYLTAGEKGTSSASKSRADTNPLNAGRNVRSSDAERLPNAPKEMLSWAKSNGWLIDNASLFPHLGNEVGGGDEHDVWGDESTQRAIKLTLDANFVQGSHTA